MVLSVFVFFALFADLLIPYEAAVIQSPKDRLMAPCMQHWLGTDEFGRDMLARIIHGSRRSLSLGVGTTAVSLLLGGIIGACCGIYGSRFDSIVMRLCDVLNCVPGLLFALAVVAALGSSMRNLLIAVTIVSLPGFIRIVRSVILSIVEQEYIMAARACDSSNFTIIMRHILPNAMAYHHSGEYVRCVHDAYGSGPVLYRNGSTAAHAGVGRYAEYGERLYENSALPASFSRNRHRSERSGAEPGGGRPAGRAGSQNESVTPVLADRLKKIRTQFCRPAFGGNCMREYRVQMGANDE